MALLLSMMMTMMMPTMTMTMTMMILGLDHSYHHYYACQGHCLCKGGPSLTFPHMSTGIEQSWWRGYPVLILTIGIRLGKVIIRTRVARIGMV